MGLFQLEVYNNQQDCCLNKKAQKKQFKCIDFCLAIQCTLTGKDGDFQAVKIILTRGRSFWTTGTLAELKAALVECGCCTTELDGWLNKSQKCACHTTPSRPILVNDNQVCGIRTQCENAQQEIFTIVTLDCGKCIQTSTSLELPFCGCSPTPEEVEGSKVPTGKINK